MKPHLQVALHTYVIYKFSKCHTTVRIAMVNICHTFTGVLGSTLRLSMKYFTISSVPFLTTTTTGYIPFYARAYEHTYIHGNCYFKVHTFKYNSGRALCHSFK